MEAYFIFVCAICIAASETVSIKTRDVAVNVVGNVKSVTIDNVKHTVYEYLGIPYAKAPVGELRFRKPEALTSLESPFNATEYGAVCPNIVSGTLSDATWKQSEDCLSINVFVPDNATDLAVMVWIHGGGFTEGSSITYDGKFLAVYGNVIVVTFNYRLSVFGFLSTNDNNARGNFGLWDQKMALQWVHDNIEHFGGNNSRVTIFGESAGAISCMAHGLIPDNYGLFQRVIAESGSPTTPIYEAVRDGFPDARLVATKVDCNHNTIEEMMSCLRSKPWQDILAAAAELTTAQFVPLVDGELINIDPKMLSTLSQTTDSELDEISFFRSLDILSGFNAYEGGFMLLYLTDPSQMEFFQPTQEMKMFLLNITLSAFLRKEMSDEVLLDMVDAEYTTWNNASNSHEIRMNIVKLLSDTIIGVPALEMTHLHKNSAASARHYMYFFTPKPPFHIFPTPSWIDGANHADEILFVFGIEHTVPGLDANSWEVQLSRNMIKYWTNFAKTGNPNSPVAVSPSWPEYNLESQHYMKLEEILTESSVQQYLNAREENFWLNVFPAIEQVLQKDKAKDHCPVSSADRSCFKISVTFCIMCFFFVSLFVKTFVSF